MNDNLKQEILNSVTSAMEVTANQMQIAIESYADTMSKLELVTYLLRHNAKK